MWRQQHVVGHHSFTNVDNYDPDIRKFVNYMPSLFCGLSMHLADYASIEVP